MASGDTLCVFTPLHNEPPASGYATLDLRNERPVLDFDAASDEAAVFHGVMPQHYGGGGASVMIAWSATSATSGDVKWNAQFERLADGGQDIDSDNFGTAQTATDTTDGTSGALTYSTIAFADAAALGSIAAGENFRLKIARDADDAADTMTGDAEIVSVEIREA